MMSSHQYEITTNKKRPLFLPSHINIIYETVVLLLGPNVSRSQLWRKTSSSNIPVKIGYFPSSRAL